MPLTKIISGAQTGADQAGLSAGKALGLETGGYIPKGKRTDDGPLSDHLMAEWGLTEHSDSTYQPRTLANVLGSDGTVIFGNLHSPGCSLTLRYCHDHNKLYIINPLAAELREWVDENDISVLNVAGNRERTNPGIFHRVRAILIEAFSG